MPRTSSLAACFCLALVSTAFAQDAPPPEPTPPLELTAPPAPSARLGEHDLKTLDGDELRANAYAAYEAGKLDVAIQLQHWGVVAREGGGEGLYNLACFYARANDVEASFYWLQRAAKEEGVDGEWAGEDPDLEPLRADARWSKLVDYFAAWKAWWSKSGRNETLLVLPSGYTKGKAIAALVGLHGLGSGPADFGDADDYQPLADAMGVAIIGVSGTEPIGPHGYVWAEDPARDAARVARALADVADRVTIAPGAVVLIGFSQGAQTAAELAARDTTTFAGAILMSPGSREDPRLGQVTKTPAHAKSGFVVRVGAGEDEGNVEQARDDAKQLRDLGCRVDEHAYEGMDDHTFPPDFADKLGEWVTFVLGERAPK